MPCIGRIGSVLVLSTATALAGCGAGAEVPVTPAAKKTGTAGATPPPTGTKGGGKKFIPRSTGRD